MHWKVRVEWKKAQNLSGDTTLFQSSRARHPTEGISQKLELGISRDAERVFNQRKSVRNCQIVKERSAADSGRATSNERRQKTGILCQVHLLTLILTRLYHRVCICRVSLVDPSLAKKCFPGMYFYSFIRMCCMCLFDVRSSLFPYHCFTVGNAGGEMPSDQLLDCSLGACFSLYKPRVLDQPWLGYWRARIDWSPWLVRSKSLNSSCRCSVSVRVIYRGTMGRIICLRW